MDSCSANALVIDVLRQPPGWGFCRAPDATTGYLERVARRRGA